MVNVSGQQCTQICRILVGAATAAFVGQKFNAIDIVKYSRDGRRRIILGERDSAKSFRLPLAIKAHHFRNLAAIDLRRSKA
jgi:hypothetical protein